MGYKLKCQTVKKYFYLNVNFFHGYNVVTIKKICRRRSILHITKQIIINEVTLLQSCMEI